MPPTADVAERSIDWHFLLSCTLTHLELTILSLLAGMAVAIPLGVLVYRLGAVARLVMYGAGPLLPAAATTMMPALAALSEAMASALREQKVPSN